MDTGGPLERWGAEDELQRRRDGLDLPPDRPDPVLRIVLLGRGGPAWLSVPNTLPGARELALRVGAAVHGPPPEPGERAAETLRAVPRSRPHAVFIPLAPGRAAPGDRDTLRLVTETFGQDLRFRTMLLLSSDEEEEGGPGNLRRLVRDSGCCWHVLSGSRGCFARAQELAEAVQAMLARTCGGFYADELDRQAEARIRHAAGLVLRERGAEIRRQEDRLRRRLRGEQQRREIRELWRRERREAREEAELYSLYLRGLQWVLDARELARRMLPGPVVAALDFVERGLSRLCDVLRSSF
ncbi:uncharacterized protein [Lepisosteus oculatus]|uniref:uncharacterized protein isoform X2 n=1 Tax=Lepisosteus oculatus TaxID=7918 RepID=UPI0035F515EF